MVYYLYCHTYGVPSTVHISMVTVHLHTEYRVEKTILLMVAEKVI
jgi:hypothetical protein